jgi:hypothetical protein
LQPGEQGHIYTILPMGNSYMPIKAVPGPGSNGADLYIEYKVAQRDYQ